MVGAKPTVHISSSYVDILLSGSVDEYTEMEKTSVDLGTAHISSCNGRHIENHSVSVLVVSEYGAPTGVVGDGKTVLVMWVDHVVVVVCATSEVGYEGKAHESVGDSVRMPI